MRLLNLEIGLALITAFLFGIGVVLAIGAGRSRHGDRLPGIFGFLAAAVALGWLCYHCISTDGPAIQTRLRSTALQALDNASLSGIGVEADGRDLALTGSVSSEDRRAQAGALALVMAGVRTVDNRISVVPAAEPVGVQDRLNQILSSRTIEFETGRDVLAAASIPVLEEVLTVLNGAPQVSVRIEGHTDNAGQAAANRALSLARARAVVAWLRSRGVSEQRMEAAGFGPDRPVADNSTEAGRARNRRVEILAR